MEWQGHFLSNDLIDFTCFYLQDMHLVIETGICMNEWLIIQNRIDEGWTCETSCKTYGWKQFKGMSSESEPYLLYPVMLFKFRNSCIWSRKMASMIQATS